MNNQVDDQPCYVMHRRPFKENSLLIDLFSLEFGRLSVVAKSVTKKGSSGAAALQVFTPLLLSWRGKSDLKTLSSYEVPTAATRLKSTSLYCGYYLNELMLYLLPEHEPFIQIFDAYTGAIALLQNSTRYDSILRHFEVRLLLELGLAPDFSVDSASKAIEADRRYRLNSDSCFEVMGSLSVAVNQSEDIARKGVSGATLLWLSDIGKRDYAEVDESPIIRREAKWLMRILIEQALNGRPLKSREMIKQLSEAKW
jgi:DNA repair protein RecO (recombination protein O)